MSASASLATSPTGTLGEASSSSQTLTCTCILDEGLESAASVTVWSPIAESVSAWSPVPQPWSTGMPPLAAFPNGKLDAASFSSTEQIVTCTALGCTVSAASGTVWSPIAESVSAWSPVAQH